MTKLTAPTTATWNCAGSLNEHVPPKVVSTRKQFGKVDFDQPESLPVSAMTTRGNYAGLELKPFEGRPGAMDAFALPSLVNGRLVVRVMGCGV
jgi:hypothetical protein